MSEAINKADFSNRTLQNIERAQGYSWNSIRLDVINEYLEMINVISQNKETFGVNIYYEILKLKKIMKEQIPEYFA